MRFSCQIKSPIKDYGIQKTKGHAYISETINVVFGQRHCSSKMFIEEGKLILGLAFAWCLRNCLSRICGPTTPEESLADGPVVAHESAPDDVCPGDGLRRLFRLDKGGYEYPAATQRGRWYGMSMRSISYGTVPWEEVGD